MNKKLLLIVCFLFCSNLIADEPSSDIIQTNVPNIYVKNLMCDPQDSYRLNYNLVNKSEKRIGSLTTIIHDLAGDPIDQKKQDFREGIYPNTGYSGNLYMKNCKQSEKNLKLRFIVQTY